MASVALTTQPPCAPVLHRVSNTGTCQNSPKHSMSSVCSVHIHTPHKQLFQLIQ